MEVHLTPEKETQLHQVAAHTGMNTSQLLEEAVDRPLAEDVRFRAAVRKGFTSLQRGDFIEEEEMSSRVGRMLRS